MKKPLLIIGVVGLVGLAAVLIFAGAPEQPADDITDVAINSPAPTHASAPDETPAEETPIESVAPDTNVPDPTADDLTEAVLDTAGAAELQFLTTSQKKELDAASIGNHEPQARAAQSFAVTWKEADLAAAIPTLPTEAPVYLLDRPTEAGLFDVVRNLADNLGINGTVIRSDKQNYAVANIMTGDYFLFYDLFHLTFEANSLKIAAVGAEAVKTALQSAGLLSFPVTESVVEEENSTWYRFTPELALPIVSMDEATDESIFASGKTGTIDVEVKNDTIVQIKNSFPNIVEKNVTALADAEAITAKLAEGNFRLGSVDLQYPGALPLEDKRKFFDLKSSNAIAISDAEISAVECGYYVETDETVQSLLAPICIAHGQGRVDSYSVLFRVVISAVSQ